MMPRPKRIICYAVNGSGLGHLTRLISIAKWLQRLVSWLDGKPPEIFFLTSSDACDLLAESRFAAFKIPSKSVVRSSDIDRLEYRRLAKHFIWQTLGVFSPDLLVVDTFPAGSFDELFQVLDGPFKKGFVFRNVKEEYARRPIFRSAISLYDSVVIPHRAGSLAALQCQTHFPGLTELPCSGDVIQFDRDHLPERADVRNELGLGNHPLIYISAGGGGDPDVESTLLSIVDALSKEPYHLLVGAGPLYRGTRRNGPNVTWCQSSSVWKWFSGCDAAISAGGYNSFHELLHAGVPCLFYSQEKVADDQWQRVRLAAQHGACRILDDPRDPRELRSKVAELLLGPSAASMKEAARSYVPENGAASCAVELLKPLYSSDSLNAAISILQSDFLRVAESISGGNAMAWIEWLKPLYPEEEVRKWSTQHAAVQAMLTRLSPAAADELQSAWSQSPDESGSLELQRKLVDLLEVISDDTSFPSPKQLADQAFRAIAATLKRYAPLWQSSNRSWNSWCSIVVDRTKRLLLVRSTLPATEMAQLLAIFPKIEDVDCVEDVFDFFQEYLERQLQQSVPIHSLLQQLQVLRLSNQSITRATLSTFWESAT